MAATAFYLSDPVTVFFISLFYFFLITLSFLSLVYIFFTLRSPARSDPPSFTPTVQTSTNRVSASDQLASEQGNESGSDLKVENISSFEEEGSNSTRNSDEKSKKKKRQRNRKKELSSSSDHAEINEEGEGVRLLMRKEKKEKLVCLYPFTSSSSLTQRKIKRHYDQLMKLQASNQLTILQVGEFANCLVEARNELQNKSEAILRKYTIRKALLSKAGRSSFNRLHEEIYKLELEHKRVEEDTFVYNWLQEQLKLSPAYKKMLEISASVDLSNKSNDLMEGTEGEFSDSDISFEELLAREKRDSFWQKHRRSKVRPS